MEVLISTNYDGLYLSDSAINRYLDIKGLIYHVEEEISFWESIKLFYVLDENGRYELFMEDDDIQRNDKALIQLYKELGDSICSYDWVKFKIVDIPDDVKFNIEGCHGEVIREISRSWN